MRCTWGLPSLSLVSNGEGQRPSPVTLSLFKTCNVHSLILFDLQLCNYIISFSVVQNLIRPSPYRVHFLDFRYMYFSSFHPLPRS